MRTYDPHVSAIGPHLLGRKVQHDPKSRAFPVASDLPVKTKSWAHYGPVLNQGNVGSCTGNAAAQAENTKPLRVKGVVRNEGDALQAYALATRLDDFADNDYPGVDEGSSGLGAAKAGVQLGWFSSYNHSFGFDHYLAGLMTGPAMVGIQWTNDMFRPDAKGLVRPTGGVAGGHEFLGLGVDMEEEILIFLNSWSKAWGHNGRFYLTFADFKALLADDGDSVFPIG